MDSHSVTLTVNGTEHQISVRPEKLLIHALRDDLDYTGPNIGCETSLCGACTVQLNGKPVKSCTVLALQADGEEVKTVEGLEENGELHHLQESFQEEHGLQCGYCTPGILMTASAFLEENPNPEREEIREALEGNLCRCTGYVNIVDAIESSSQKIQTEE